MMTDPIADMLTRIRNANSVRQRTVGMPASRMKVGIAQVLKDEGFIQDYGVQAAEPASLLTIHLKYGSDGQAVIRNIDRVSKPGRRVYSSVKDLPHALRGLGCFVLSSPQGVISDRTARKENLGGEILCRVS